MALFDSHPELGGIVCGRAHRNARLVLNADASYECNQLNNIYKTREFRVVCVEGGVVPGYSVGVGPNCSSSASLLLKAVNSLSGPSPNLRVVALWL